MHLDVYSNPIELIRTQIFIHLKYLNACHLGYIQFVLNEIYSLGYELAYNCITKISSSLWSNVQNVYLTKSTTLPRIPSGLSGSCSWRPWVALASMANKEPNVSILSYIWINCIYNFDNFINAQYWKGKLCMHCHIQLGNRNQKRKRVLRSNPDLLIH